ncbi:MAG: TlpA family protein disulfide reductase [Solirubrobacterales bacterium]|nr:TlpA family protein disulfide reductase [Solirubrobacterales bacterium]
MSGPLDFDDGDEPDRWAHRRDPDLPPPSEAVRRGHVPVPRPPGMSRYTWFLGVVGVLLVAVVLLNGIGSSGTGSKGIPAGKRMPPFAAPLATASLEGDVNVQTGKDDESAGARPACRVRGRDVLNVCALWERGPVVLAFLATRGDRCVRELDVVERVRRRFPGVQFAAVAVRGDRERLRRLIAARGWGFPVGYDRDGALANLYGVAVCPQITFARRGGKVVETTFGELSESELAAEVRRVAR